MNKIEEMKKTGRPLTQFERLLLGYVVCLGVHEGECFWSEVAE